MSLPEMIEVRISSEGAESNPTHEAVVQEIGTRELLERVLGVAGKDTDRVREILRQGTLVSGDSFLSWNPIDAEPDEITERLGTFPDSDPARKWDPGLCIQATLHLPPGPLVLTKAVASKRRFLRRHSFWGVLINLIYDPRYVDYSYRDRADLFAMDFSEAAQRRLMSASQLIDFAPYREIVAEQPCASAELLVTRP